MRSLKFVVVAALCAVGCGGAVDSSDLSSDSSAIKSDENPQQIQYMRGEDDLLRAAKPGGGGSGNTNLIDHGGPVLPSDTTYAIWWGPSSAWPSDAQTGISALFGGFNGSSFLGIANQYMRGAKATTSFVRNLTDTSSSPPTRSPSTSSIVAEACKVITANGIAPSSTSLYLVYTSNFPRHVNFCAWHSYGTCNGTTIQVAYMPNTTGIAGCDPGNLYNCNGYSQGTRSLANVSSHEYMETLTDPDISAWYDSSGSEIGDKCAWTFASCVNLSNGNWQLQQEWSNAISGCQQQ